MYVADETVKNPILDGRDLDALELAQGPRESLLLEISRIKGQRERFRTEAKTKREVEQKLSSAMGKVKGWEIEAEKLQDKIDGLREELRESEKNLLSASGVTKAARERETIKKLQSSDLKQRKNMDIMDEQIKWLLRILRDTGWKGDVNDAPLPQYMQRDISQANLEGTMFGGYTQGAAVGSGDAQDPAEPRTA